MFLAQPRRRELGIKVIRFGFAPVENRIEIAKDFYWRGELSRTRRFWPSRRFSGLHRIVDLYQSQSNRARFVRRNRELVMRGGFCAGIG